MKITLTFKTPDVIANAVDHDHDGKFSDNESLEKAVEEAQRKLAKWVKYGEYVAIDFDTDAGTATVLKLR